MYEYTEKRQLPPTQTQQILCQLYENHIITTYPKLAPFTPNHQNGPSARSINPTQSQHILS